MADAPLDPGLFRPEILSCTRTTKKGAFGTDIGWIIILLYAHGVGADEEDGEEDANLLPHYNRTAANKTKCVCVCDVCVCDVCVCDVCGGGGGGGYSAH